jgi:hypothetical protein
VGRGSHGPFGVRSLYFTILKNLMVFETKAALAAFTQDAGGVEPYACALDFYENGEVSHRPQRMLDLWSSRMQPVICFAHHV